MKEIFTLNLGYTGNYPSAYFWQIQDMYDNSWDFHSPYFIKSAEGYFPRMVGIDYKESLSFPDFSKTEEKLLWEGKTQIIQRDSSTEEKWTDLLLGMISRRNLVPVYRDEAPFEEIEDRIRFFAENSDKLQGIHVIQDCLFEEITTFALNICSDFYAKIPILLFSLNFQFNNTEEIMIHKLSEFSSLLHVPCTVANTKNHLAKLGTAIDAICYYYRKTDDMTTVFSEFLNRPRGNSAGLVLNSFEFLESRNVLLEKDFIRNPKINQKIPVPPSFPEPVPEDTTATLKISESLAEFYQTFITKPNFRVNQDDILEARNYLSYLSETYQSANSNPE